MQWVVERAARVRALHGVRGVPDDAHLDALLAAEGLDVEEGWVFTGRVREAYSAGMLGIRAGLSSEWVRWLKAHGLAHHLLHRGNHLYAEGTFHLWQRHEVEAELFAGTLLLADAPPPVFNLPRLAELGRVPLECVRSWQVAYLVLQEERVERLSEDHVIDLSCALLAKGGALRPSRSGR
jgi:hypothetical protein